MNKTVLVVAAGLLALTGAAMAEQAIVVHEKIQTPAPAPADDLSVSTGQGEIPDAPALPLGEAADGANAALDENGVPAGLAVQKNRARASLSCDVEVLDGLPCHNEPWVDNPADDRATFGPHGVVLHPWIKAGSGEAFGYAAEKVPPEQREPLEQASEQVNLEAAAALTDDAILRAGQGAIPRLFGGDGELVKVGRLKALAEKAAGAAGVLGEGQDARWSPEGFDEFFANDAPGLQSTSTGGDHGIPAEPDARGEAPDTTLQTAMLAVAGLGLVLGPMALYHRIRSNHALNNKTRQSVFDAVVRTPGIGVNEAARAAGCSYSTAAYHLERLVEERLLVASEDGRRARFFKNGGAFSQQEREFVPILQSQEAMNVLQVIVENPWCYRAEVAQKLGVSGPTVNWHLKKLMGAGVVREMREGRVSYLYADKKLLNQLGANLVGKMPDDLVARLRFEARPEVEMVEPALALPETSVPEIGLGEVDLAPLPEAKA